MLDHSQDFITRNQTEEVNHTFRAGVDPFRAYAETEGALK